MQAQVLDFQTGNEVEKIPVPVFVEQLQERGIDAILSYLYKSKKVSFEKKACAKGISDVSGTTKKPFKQKGTGNARQGSLRAPQFRGGGVIFGPIPVTANYRINKSESRYVKKLLIAKLFELNKIKIVDKISIPEFSTKGALTAISNVALSNSVCLVHDCELSRGSLVSLRNIFSVSSITPASFFVHELLRCDVVLMTKQAFDKLSQTI